jgi:hypothetical protein
MEVYPHTWLDRIRFSTYRRAPHFSPPIPVRAIDPAIWTNPWPSAAIITNSTHVIKAVTIVIDLDAPFHAGDAF